MSNQPHILVIGDIMLDQYISGQVTRISPEAPVPVVKVDKEWSTLGGAANVAANAASLGAEVSLIGLIGNDDASAIIEETCGNSNIDFNAIIGDQPTIVKTRVVSGQQIVRFDKEEQLIWSDSKSKELEKKLVESISNCDLILLSDYAKGTLSDEVLKVIFAQAKAASKRVLVDPKRSDWNAYRGAYLVTPNLKELGMTKAGLDVKNNDAEVVSICHKLKSSLDIENIVATRSSYGMTVVSEKGLLNIPTRALEVFDVSGAGDTVLASFGVSLAEGKSLNESAFIANAAAGIVVSKRGTAVVQKSELSSFLNKGKKQVSKSELSEFKSSNVHKKVVFTNGCFDVLHQGHRKLLADAKKLGDVLVVGLNSDVSIKRLKGENRPVNQEKHRIEALTALPFVDAIMVFGEDTPYELLSELKPNVLVKGGDYKPDEVVGKDLVDDVVIVPLVEGLSTTNLLSE